MFGTFLDLLRTRTARHTFTLFLGSLTSKGIAFALLFWLARLLDRSDYDLFAVAWTIMLIVYEFTELGMNVTLVRHAAERVGANQLDRAAGLFRLAATLKVGLFALVFVVGWLLSGMIAEKFLGGSGRSSFVVLAVLGGFGLGGIVLLNGVFYSHKQFYKDVIVSVTQNLAKLGAVAALGLAGQLTLSRVVSLYAGAAWIAVCLGVILLPRSARRWGILERSDVKSISRFGAAYAVVAVLASLQNRLGVFLLKGLAPPGEAADYTLAFHLTAIFLFLLGAYYNVMFSRISSIREWKEVLRIQVKSILPLGVLSAGAGLIILSAGFFIPLILPPKYSGTVPSARWLLLSVVFIAMGMPAGMVLLHAKRLVVVAGSYVVSLGLLVVLARAWVPRWGAPGMAAANCAMVALVNVSLVAYTLLLVRRGGPLGGGASSP